MKNRQREIGERVSVCKCVGRGREREHYNNLCIPEIYNIII